MCDTCTSSSTPFVVKEVSFWGSLIQDVLGVLSYIVLTNVRLLPHTLLPELFGFWFWVLISLLSLLALISWFRMLKTLFCLCSGFFFVSFCLFCVVAIWHGSLEVLRDASGREGTGVCTKHTQNCAFWNKVTVRLIILAVLPNYCLFINFF